MIYEHNVKAGTILHFDFDDLKGTWPEFEGKHPAVVISPAKMQRSRTVIVVPITSDIRNETNPSAVRLTHKSFIGNKGQAYAICNLPIALSLDRASLDYYRRVRKSDTVNHIPKWNLKRDDMSRIRAKLVEHLYGPERLRSDERLRELLVKTENAPAEMPATFDGRGAPSPIEPKVVWKPKKAAPKTVLKPQLKRSFGRLSASPLAAKPRPIVNPIRRRQPEASAPADEPR